MAQNGLAPNFKSGFDIGVAMKNARKIHGASGDAIADAKSVLEVIDQKILKRAYISIDNALKVLLFLKSFFFFLLVNCQIVMLCLPNYILCVFKLINIFFF